MFDITIASQEEALKNYQAAKYIISISDIDVDPPVFDHPSVLTLQFDDITQIRPGYEPFDGDHFDAIVEFTDNAMKNPGPMLIHCGQGVSRSSAVAMIVLNVVRGPGNEKTIFQELKAKFPHIKPNERVLIIADYLMENDGAIKASVR